MDKNKSYYKGSAWFLRILTPTFFKHDLATLKRKSKQTSMRQIANFSLIALRAKLLQSCPTLCDPMDCSPPSSSVRGILQVILDWVAMPSSRGSSQLRDQTYISYVSCLGRRVLYHLHHLGSCQTHLP